MANSDLSTRMASKPAGPEDIGRSYKSAWTDPPPATDDDPLLGTTLSRTYRITGILGEGGMGRVYEAWHTRIKQKRYAVKVLHPEYARSAEVLSRFQREAEAAALISHANAVGVYDVALTPQGWPYLVCDFLEGIDFSEHLKTHAPLAPNMVKHIALQICDALKAAHACGVIHRDLKPQNVFLVGDFDDGVPEYPMAKVLDFGLSRLLDSADSELTKTGMIMGTPSYMAPEQARGERVDHRCDIYGVGAIMFAALTGRPPFKTETPQATVLAVMNDDPPRPTSLNPSIPGSLELVVQKAMAKDPSQRYPDMASLQEAIGELNLGREKMLSVDGSGTAKTQVLAQRTLEEQNFEVKTARFRLVLVGLLATVLLLAGISAAVAGAITLIADGWPLTHMETVLTLLIVVGTLLTPTLLLVRRLRKTVWNNSAHVVSALHRTRIAVNAGMFAYGTCALGWLFVDDVLIHFVELPGVAVGSGLHWPGTAIVLLAAAATSSAGGFLKVKLNKPAGWIDTQQGSQRRLRRFIAGPLLTLGSVTAVFAILLLGTAWRHHSSATPGVALGSDPPEQLDALTVAVELPTTTTADASPTAAEASDAVPEPQAAQEPAGQAPGPGELASKEELSAAISRGLEGLQPLLEKHPLDPDVLRAVAFAQASRASGLVDSIGTLKRLFEVAPRAVNDSDLQSMVMQMTRSRSARDAAFNLMGSHMGAVGADMLYKVALSRPSVKDTALKTLAKPSVREHFSPALSIAYDLRYAKSCKARLALLPRAKQFGDERAIRVLTPLATPPNKCAKRPCKPSCPEEADEYLAATESITSRLQRSTK